MSTVHFQMAEQDAVALINYLGQQPINSGLTPMVAMLVAQFNESKEQRDESKPKDAQTEAGT